MDFDRLFAVKPAPIRFAKRIASVLLPALLLFALLPSNANAQAGVQGSVTNAQGDPLIGAQIQVVGTNMGAVTDADGRYQISGVMTGSVQLRAQYLGYREVTRSVTLASGNNTVNFELSPAPVELDAIVVTGTAGQVQKRSLGNAVSQIDAARVLEKAPVTNLAQLIEGRAAGVNVLSSAGTVGAGSALRLRGLSSITQGNDPLIYIDGVRVDNDPTGISGFTVGGQSPSRLNDITTEDIESIEIIKGPAAATLYGTEAAAGVIQIITKKGLSGETRWNLKASLGRTDLDNNDFPNNFAAIGPDASLPTCPENDITSVPNCGVRVVETLSNGNQLIAQNPTEILADNGLYQDYTASVSGGQEAFTFFASGNFKDTEGALPQDEAQKISGRANFQWTQGEVFDLSVSSGYTNNEYTLPNNDNNIFGFFGNLFLGRPDRVGLRGGRPFVFGAPFTPIVEVDEIESMFTNDRFTGSVTANYNPFPWFRNRVVFGLDVNAEENTQFIPFGAVLNLSPQGEKTNNRSTAVNVTFDYNGTGSWDVTEALRSNTSVGAQIFNENVDTVTAFGQDFPAPGVSTVSAAGTTLADEFRTENTTVGVYIQEQIAWQNRLFLTGAVRFDDNSAFGEDFDFETYPKVSASWVISEEEWFDFGLFNTLKLRSAYGFAGQQPSAFAAQRTFTPVSIRAGEAAISTGQVGNPDLGPERSRELEIGADASLWDDRIGFEVTYYDKVTEDALVGRPNIPSEGFPGTQLFNIGELENSGWEYGVNALLLDTETFDWDLNLTFSTNENEVVSLGDAPDFPVGFNQRVKEGTPLDAFYGLTIVGREGDTPVFSDEEQFLGRATPGRWGSLGNTITLWDNVQIYALLDWKSDFQVYNGTRSFRFQFGSERALWDPELQDQEFSDIINFINLGQDTPFMEDGDFVKLREVSATVTLPRDWANRLRARRASLTFAGRNLATWTDYSGVDPEVNVFGQAQFARGDFLSAPQSRLFLTTLNLTF